LVAERQGQVVLAKVNLDEAQVLAQRLGIESIPLVVAYRDGRPVREFLGLLPEEQVRAFLEQLLPSGADQLVEQARGLEQSQPGEPPGPVRTGLRAGGEGRLRGGAAETAGSGRARPEAGCWPGPRGDGPGLLRAGRAASAGQRVPEQAEPAAVLKPLHTMHIK